MHIPGDIGFHCIRPHRLQLLCHANTGNDSEIMNRSDIILKGLVQIEIIPDFKTPFFISTSPFPLLPSILKIMRDTGFQRTQIFHIISLIEFKNFPAFKQPLIMQIAGCIPEYAAGNRLRAVNQKVSSYLYSASNCACSSAVTSSIPACFRAACISATISSADPEYLPKAICFI